MKQLNNGLKIMKENKIIHRDLKLENILIKYEDENKKNYIIKLSDYGCSKRLDSLSKNYCNTNAGTLTYMAPEILNGKEYNYKCDLWSIGIIIYRLKFVKSPFSGITENAIINNIKNFKNKLINTGNKELDDLIQKLLEKNNEKRIKWDEYFNHPFFNSFLNNKIIDNKKEENNINNKLKKEIRDNDIFDIKILGEDYPDYDLSFKIILIGNSGKKFYAVLFILFYRCWKRRFIKTKK